MVLGILAALAGIFKITYTSIIINAPLFMNKTVLNLFVIIFMFFLLLLILCTIFLYVRIYLQGLTPLDTLRQWFKTYSRQLDQETKQECLETEQLIKRALSGDGEEMNIIIFILQCVDKQCIAYYIRFCMLLMAHETFTKLLIN